ncbi:hypothetical protein LJB71_00585 [Thermomonas sp. S9]|nr:hypothetical protein [Thermomonas sp. S9]
MSTAAEAYAAAAQPGLRPMREADLEAVMAIERRAYPFPWTPGIFRDCLRAGYAMWVPSARTAGWPATACSASPPTRRMC